jgi:hypothetical protein
LLSPPKRPFSEAFKRGCKACLGDNYGRKDIDRGKTVLNVSALIVSSSGDRGLHDKGQANDGKYLGHEKENVHLGVLGFWFSLELDLRCQRLCLKLPETVYIRLGSTASILKCT